MLPLHRQTKAVALLIGALLLSGCAALVQHPAPRPESDISHLRLADAWAEIAAYGEFEGGSALTNHFELVWDAANQLEHLYLPFVVPDRKGGWTAVIADYLPAAQGGSHLRAYPLRDAPDPAAYVSVVAVLEEIDRQGLAKLAEDLGGRRRVLAVFQVGGPCLGFGDSVQHRAYALRAGQREPVGPEEMCEVSGCLATLTLVPLSQGEGDVASVVYLFPELR